MAVLAILLGACCLLTAATGLAVPGWPSPTVANLLVTWAPVLCLVVLAGLGVTLSHPKALQVSPPMIRLLFLSLAVVGVMGLLWVWKVLISR